MTKTIELKTIVTADEPDRTKKYKGSTAFTDGSTGMRCYLQYDEVREGWTWGTKWSAHPWDEVVRDNESMFPLTEVEPQVDLTDGEFTFTDVGNDRLRMRISGDLVRLYIDHPGGDGFRSIHFKKKDVARLKEFFDEHVKVTEV